MNSINRLFILLLVSIICSCTINNNNNNNPSNPPNTFPNLSLINANPNYDASYFGVYKGIIGDSTNTGNILIDFNNSQSTAKAYLTFRGSQYIFSQTDIANVNGVITVTLEKDNQVIKLTVSDIGNNPTISYISINGSIEYGSAISKEKSTNKVKCFEGKYNSDTSSCGTFTNMPLGVVISGRDARILLYVKSPTGIGSGYYYYTPIYDINTQKINLSYFSYNLPGTNGYVLFVKLDGNVTNNNANGTFHLYVARVLSVDCEGEGDWTSTKTL